ncbi:putative kelch-like protein 5, partial [Apostichopus japonicus]
METTKDGEIFKAPNHAERTLGKIQTYLQKQLLIDVILRAGNVRIESHRVILSAVSDYFAAMFTSNVQEANEMEVVLHGIDPQSLRDCIQYIYTGMITLSESTVEKLLATASILQLSEVVMACCTYLVKQLHPSNCLGIRSFADQQGCLDLLRAAHTYTMEHFVMVTQNQEFLMLHSDDVRHLLASDDLNVPSEETVYHALLAWAKNDLVHRKKDLSQLLAEIRLPLLSPQFLSDTVDSESLIKENTRCQRLVMEAMKYHLLPERRPQLQNTRTKPRKSTVGDLFIVGGMDNPKGATVVEKFDLRTSSWSSVTHMKSRRLQFGAVAIEGRILLVGGRDGLKTLNSVESFHPKSKTWSMLPPMNTHRHGLGVAVLEGPVYAVGGHDGWSYLATVERYDPINQQWDFVPQMSSPRSTMGVAVLQNKLYAVGGRDGSACLRTVELYDPHINRWSLCAPMSKRRGGLGVIACGGCLYAIGGHDTPASQEASRQLSSVE